MRDNIVYFVKPHPPREIMRRRCPIPEKYRYDWEPLALKYLAHELKRKEPGLDVRLWHLMDARDDRAFLLAVAADRPRAVFFTELDVLVNEVNRLARLVKAASPRTVTAVGGKQTSLLDPGDRLPFPDVDFAAAGDGVGPVLALFGGASARDGLFLSWDKRTGRVTDAPRNRRNGGLRALDPRFRLIPVVNHSFDEYVSRRQEMPALTGAGTRTAPLLIGTGCPYRCFFCQAPRDFGPADAAYLLREPALVAEEMIALMREWRVNHFFSLESNMHLGHLGLVYEELERRGVGYCQVSGFVRSADLLAARERGLLPALVRRGFRFVHTGIDVVLGGRGDEYGKNDSLPEIRRALEACREHGLIVVGTYIGSPASTPAGLHAELEELAALPLADVDVRLAIALRHTEFYRRVEERLILHPDRDARYFDRQNYRYQTVRFPGRITPRQTYAIVNDFLRRFPGRPERLSYARDMARGHPETRAFFAARFGEPVLDAARG
jgi:radical SAM superfamily enzyme YgiQ (UPF0313 family)